MNARELGRGELLTAAVAALLSASCASAAQSYRIDTPRQAQQGNFCDDTPQVDEIVAVFERFGAPTGFSALSASPACTLQVHGFTPRALYRQVKIELSDGGYYTIRFIRVELTDGQRRILVTTRGLQPRSQE